ncbi:protein of unknown function (plasmid) [Thauera humireducens]|nr:protein of unknown function [Thauera humireducens]
MPNHAGVLQSLFFPAKLETEGDGSIFNTLLEMFTINFLLLKPVTCCHTQQASSLSHGKT